MNRKSWFMGLLGVVISTIMTTLLVRYFLYPQREKLLKIGKRIKPPTEEVDEQIVIEEAEPCEPDDLTVVEGIGPKTSAALQEAGITTYAQLAATDVEAIKDILRKAGIRVAVSETWTEQAQLAAVGDWDGLAEWQAQLKGGRR